MPKRRKIRNNLVPSDLKGLTFAGYIRESTPEQGDKYGPDAQASAIAEWGRRNGLVDSGIRYSEFESAWKANARSAIYETVHGIKEGQYQVLLFACSDRYSRNIREAYEIRDQITGAGGHIVFCDLNLIAGQAGTAMMEGFMYIANEQYSALLSGRVFDALREQALLGGVNGNAPLGTKHAMRPNTTGKLIRVLELNHDRLSVLRDLLTHYADRGSCRTTAAFLNARGFTTERGGPFTQDSVKEIIRNPVYGPNEVVIYHKGDVDEVRRSTPPDLQIFPEEIHDLWTQCQEKKAMRSVRAAAATRGRIYPLHDVLRCTGCHSVYNGQPRKTKRETGRHSVHKSRGVPCGDPSRVNSEILEDQLLEMLQGVELPRNWRDQILKLIGLPKTDDCADERARLQTAIRKVKDQHKWGIIDDDEFIREVRSLQDQLDAFPMPLPIELETYRIPAELLRSVGGIVGHPAIRLREDGMRLLKEFCNAAFTKIEVDRARLVAVHPKDRYRELFAVALVSKKREFVCGREDSNLHGCYPTWT